VTSWLRRFGRIPAAGPPGLFTYRQAAVDQLRMNALTPMSIFSTLAMPCVVAFIIQSHEGHGHARGTTTALAVGVAGVGMLDSVIISVVIGLLGEKQWKTLYAALGSPVGLVPVVMGRLSGMAVQSAVTLPGAFAFLALLWGIDGHFNWVRWIIGGLVLTFCTVSVMGLLGCAVLRFAYSAGMTNGLIGLFIALSALVVPRSAMPAPVAGVASLLPQSHVMGWVRGGGVDELAIAIGLGVIYCGLIIVAMRRVEQSARRLALPLEV
jgi:ABC-type multidrug transport system permease subunit